MTEGEELLELLERSGALERGHFVLSSGLHSPVYVQCALLLQEPPRAKLVGQALAQRLAPHTPTSILSPALGGVIIGHEVAAALGIPFRFAERLDGSMQLRRGFELSGDERVAIVEDVVTTGESIREVAGLVRARGAEVVAFGAILDRTAGWDDVAIPLLALARLDLPVYARDICPLCREGGEPESPGSRKSDRRNQASA